MRLDSTVIAGFIYGQFDPGSLFIQGKVSRMDRYAETGSCALKTPIESYCICRDFLSNVSSLPLLKLLKTNYKNERNK